jgi:hypothetical protein
MLRKRRKNEERSVKNEKRRLKDKGRVKERMKNKG